jgi:hypothetical protein
MAPAVEHLTSKNKALNSNPSTTRKKSQDYRCEPPSAGLQKTLKDTLEALFNCRREYCVPPLTGPQTLTVPRVNEESSFTTEAPHSCSIHSS